MNTLFVWDFHGVLEKNNEYAVQEVVNRVLTEFKVDKKATVQECIDLYGKRWFDYFKYCAPSFDDDVIQKMVFRAVEISVGEKVASKYIIANDYAHDVLGEITKKGHMNIVMSNSNPDALAYFLESVNMQNIFDYEYAADGHKIKYVEDPKEVWLRNFLEKNNFDKVVVIDDSFHGIEMGIKFGAITYHYRRDERFGNSKADNKITDLREVLKEL